MLTLDPAPDGRDADAPARRSIGVLDPPTEPQPLLGTQILRTAGWPEKKVRSTIAAALPAGNLPLALQLWIDSTSSSDYLAAWTEPLPGHSQQAPAMFPASNGIQQQAAEHAWTQLARSTSWGLSTPRLNPTFKNILRRLSDQLALLDPYAPENDVAWWRRDVGRYLIGKIHGFTGESPENLAVIPRWVADQANVTTYEIPRPTKQRRQPADRPDRRVQTATRMRDAGQNWAAISRTLGCTVADAKNLVAETKKQRRAQLADTHPRRGRDDETAL